MLSALAGADAIAASEHVAAEKLDRVVVHADRLEVYLHLEGKKNEPTHPIILPWRVSERSRHHGIQVPAEKVEVSRWADRKVIRAEARARLIEAIAMARRNVERILAGDDEEIASIAAEEGCSERSVRMNLSLAFLSPQIVKGAIEGTLPHRFGVSGAVNLGACWHEQAIASARPL